MTEEQAIQELHSLMLRLDNPLSPQPPREFVLNEDCLSSDWPRINQRRVELIHKRADRTLLPEEEQELDSLQQLADARIRELAPLPIGSLEAMRDELKKRGMWEEE